MFEVFNRSLHRQRVDLASVRDTLLYIESDLGDAPHLERLADAVRSALAEIDRMELSSAPFEMPQISQARFLPAQL